MPNTQKIKDYGSRFYRKVEDIPGFAGVLAKSKAILSETPQPAKPSSYREYEAKQTAKKSSTSKGKKKPMSSLKKKEAEQVFNLAMNAAENGIDYALTYSGFAEEQTNDELAKLIKKHEKARGKLIAKLSKLAENQKVLDVANKQGTDMYQVDDENEFRAAIANW